MLTRLNAVAGRLGVTGGVDVGECDIMLRVSLEGFEPELEGSGALPLISAEEADTKKGVTGETLKPICGDMLVWTTGRRNEDAPLRVP